MGPVAIRKAEDEASEARFIAVAGERRSQGRTMGEALDALAADWGDETTPIAVFIHRFQPDEHFTQAQFVRMQDLLGRRATLTPEERNELEALVDAELDATVARTDPLVHPAPP